jgi:Imidazoleglycerol-phosphate synthase
MVRQPDMMLNCCVLFQTGVSIPLIASGGAGTQEHVRDAILLGKADAVLAASIFHYNKISISELKSFLHNNNIPVRL